MKFISGWIIPAIKLTTSAVTGFNSSQFISFLIKEKIDNVFEKAMGISTSFMLIHYSAQKKK